MLINLAGGRIGPMGKVHRPLFEQAGYEVIVSGRNPDPANGVYSFEDGAKNSDITIVTVPIEATPGVIKRVAPHCQGALMDFTGIKVIPLETMAEFAPENCERGGLHPMYGNVPSVKGRAVYHCKVKEGPLCQGIISTFRNAGANIIEVTPWQHDSRMAKIQNEGTVMLSEIYPLLAKLKLQDKLTPEETYRGAPPMLRARIALLARAIAEPNDHIYQQMFDHNQFSTIKMNWGEMAQAARELYGEKFLAQMQEKAKEIIALV